eukprot:1130214-Pleurochrysis_carterae.AAC.2
MTSPGTTRTASPGALVASDIASSEASEVRRSVQVPGRGGYLSSRRRGYAAADTSSDTQGNFVIM